MGGDTFNNKEVNASHETAGPCRNETTRPGSDRSTADDTGEKREMVICYHCDGKPIGETIFPYSPAAYADWLRSMAAALSHADPAFNGGK